MIQAKKTAQTRLTASRTKELATYERPPIQRPILHKPYAKKRRMERRFVRNTVPPRPVLQTLMGMIEHAYLIKAIDKW